MKRTVAQERSAAEPPQLLYAGTVGGVAVLALIGALTWFYQNPGYFCAGARAMCEERERLTAHVPRAEVMTTVALPVPAPRLSLQVPPQPQTNWRKAEDGCPPHYRPINGACWLGVEEPSQSGTRR